MKSKGSSVEKVRKELKTTKTELKTEIKELGEEMKGEISSLRADMSTLRTELKQDIRDGIDYLGEKMVKHFYIKGEIDKKFDQQNKKLDKVSDDLSLFRQEFNVFRTTDFAQSLESIDFLHQKLDKVAQEPKATKLQADVDDLRARVIKTELIQKTDG